MNIHIVNNEIQFDNRAAWKLLKAMLEPGTVIGLSTGKTTGNLHRTAANLYKQSPFDISTITFLGIDEITNIPRDFRGACYTMIKEELLNSLDLPEENFIMPPTISDDFEKECRIFQEKIENKGGIDILFLGIGDNGHLGFNQPGTSFEQETWVSQMDEKLESRIRKETGTPSDISLGGLTLGLKNIMHARKIVLLAKGISKAEILYKTIYGPITTAVPASILQLHPNCEFLLDKDAAKNIISG